ncbi:MAG: BamA/TamA family outer membrane protein [Halobacteriovoraceae bacterium]|nr:BamA/TamA family outer membrane protein [Halobacteriovoraceae bacterium]
MKRILAAIFYFIVIFQRAYSIELEVNCPNNKFCMSFREQARQFFSDEMIDQTSALTALKILFLSDNIKNAGFKLIGNGQNIKKIIINVNFKKVFKGFEFIGNDSLAQEMIDFNNKYKTGDFITEDDVEEFRQSILLHLQNKGHRNIKYNLRLEENEDGLFVRFQMEKSDFIILKSVNIVTSSDIESLRLKNRFKKLSNKKWDKIKFNIVINELKDELLKMGYYFVNIKQVIPQVEDSTISIKIDLEIDLGQKFNLYIEGNKHLEIQELRDILYASLRESQQGLDIPKLKEAVNSRYELLGVFGTKTYINVINYLSKTGEITNVYLNIQEGKKIKIKSISFDGNQSVTDSKLKNLFYEFATGISKNGHYNLEYLQNFKEHIKEEYFKNGFPFVKIDGPIVYKSKQYDVLYRIDEDEQTIIDDVNIQGIEDKNLQKEVKDLIELKKGEPLNYLAIDSQITKVIQYLKNQGFFFARLSQDPSQLIQYVDGYKTARLNFAFDIQKKIKFNRIIISGLKKTRPEVILREFPSNKGDILSDVDIHQFKDNLSSLEVFSFVRVSVVPLNREIQTDEFYNVNILVQVNERNPGIFEVAPGYRTDIGLKLSTSLKYINLYGLNRILSLDTVLNQRLDKNNIESERLALYGSELEYLAKVKYIEPYLFGTKIQFENSLSTQRKRYVLFDADTLSADIRFSRYFTKFFSLGLQYEIEDIKQFNSLDKLDDNNNVVNLNRYFRIGSISPNMLLDFRDNKTNPRKGFFSGIFFEYSSPDFGSMKKEDYEVKFYKLIFRNKMYWSAKNWGIAISYTLGKQKNLSDIISDSNGIPPTKIFRLSGLDFVRGYSDELLNQRKIGDSSKDITELLVTDSLYMTSMKIEPRIFYSDTINIGLFYDAGSLSFDKLKLFGEKATAGISFKYLTPVGSLDLDYGVKLNKTDRRIEFARWHLSIGTF